MQMDSQVRGVLGEVRAEQMYVGQGFEILARNFHIPGAEIDLIARRDDLIVFVEVKLRKDGAQAGRLAVTRDKQRRISSGALTYMTRNGLTTCQARFDVIEIQGERLTHIPDAFPYQGPMF